MSWSFLRIKRLSKKGGGNLAAPLPKDKIGCCGYYNDMTEENLKITLNEYKDYVSFKPRKGLGIDVHCHDVGLADPSTKAGDAFEMIGQSKN